MKTVGFLAFGPPPPTPSPNRQLFSDSLRDQGLVEGKDYKIELRNANPLSGDFNALAADLVQRNVDVIVASGTPAIEAAQAATSTIPIVMTVTGHPTASGPGSAAANVTGLTRVAAGLNQRRLDLLQQVVPHMTALTIVSSAGDPDTAHDAAELTALAQQRGLTVETVEVQGPDGYSTLFDPGSRQGAVCLGGSLNYTFRKKLVEAVAAAGIPAIYVAKEFVQRGGLMSYGPSIPELYRRAAHYVAAILEGCAIGDLPLIEPTTFELALNLQTAKDLQLTFPPKIRVEADFVYAGDSRQAQASTPGGA